MSTYFGWRISKAGFQLAARFVIGLLALAATAAGQQSPRNLNLVKDPALTGPQIPHSYALVVGISRYQRLPAQGQLKYPERDAADIYTALISAEGGQFPAENVHRLIGSQATLTNLRHELEDWLPAVTKDDDRVLIYFAGHGFISDQRAYLAPYDISLSNIAGSAYPMDQLGRVIASKIKGKWKVLLTDACHSGAITPEAGTQQINSNLLQLDRSLFSLTASRDREQSFESPTWGGGHGAFTYFLIKGLQGEADSNGDGIVDADELAEYVRGNVRRETGARQNPTSERGSFDPKMVLAYNPTRATAAPTQPPQFGAFAIISNMDAVEVFVDGASQGVVNKDKPLNLPGMAPGVHVIKAVRMGYEPDGPREQMIYPGQTTAVTIRIVTLVHHKKAALDEFDRGMELYQKGFDKNYTKAVQHFETALSLDPTFSAAALYLARAYNALYDEDKAKQAFQRAIQLDPDYAEARTSYGGMLLDLGDADEAIRQLNASVTREPGNAVTNALLSQAFTRKAAYSEAERFGREAVRLMPGYPEAHFMLAESLRPQKKCPEATAEYQTYLKLSDFDSKIAGQLNYYVLGYVFGMGKKTRAAQTDIWREQQFLANFGLCDCARMSQRVDSAIGYCERALSRDSKDLFAHYDLGLSFLEKFNQANSAGVLVAARQHFETVIQLNPDAAEADKAKKYVEQIDKVLVKLGQATPSTGSSVN